MTVNEFARKGGKARAVGLTAERRKEIAENAAAARWKRNAENKRKPSVVKTLR